MSNPISRYAYRCIAAIVFALILSASIDAKAADAPPVIESAKAAWHEGSARYDFVMDEQTLAIKPLTVTSDDRIGTDGPVRCILVVPKRATSGNPWSWRDLYRNHQPPAQTELLARGFHVAYITPGPLRQRDAWYAFLTEKHRLSRKPVFVGMSTAGELRAGTAKVSITPEDGKTPVHDKVYARSLILDVDGERVAFVSVDLGIYISEKLVAVCKERFGISHLVLSSSHTHSGPGRNYAAFFEERLIQVMEAAVNDMFPARISAGHRGFPQLGFNRLVVRDDGHARESWFADGHYTSENPERIPFGPVDPEVGGHQDRRRARSDARHCDELRLPCRRRLSELRDLSRFSRSSHTKGGGGFRQQS
jgi:hypothetical protein